MNKNSETIKKYTDNKIESDKEKEKLTDKSSMRTAFIRVSGINILKEDNPELGFKAGDAVTYDKEKLIAILEDWAKTKDFDYYLIEHNDDPDNIHCHIVLNLTRSQATFAQVKKHFPYGSIEPCGKYLKRKGVDKTANTFMAVSSCVNYMVHNTPSAIADGKKPYEWEEIITNTPDMLEIYKNGYVKKNRKKILEKYIEKITRGELREYEINKIEPNIYSQYKNRITNAFEQYKKIYIEKNKDRNVSVFWLEGPAGYGKTTFCKAFASKGEKSYSLSQSGKNGLEGYHGEEVFVLDDADFKDISINALKNILENNTCRELGIRYTKTVFMGDTIMICSNESILNIYPKEDELSKQAIYRRIKCVFKFESFDAEKMVAHISVNEIYTKSKEELKEDERRIKEKDFGDMLNDDIGIEELIDNLKRKYVFKKLDEFDFDLKPYLPEVKDKKEDIHRVLSELSDMGIAK